MVSVRNQGRSFGPISYEFTGSGGRNTLLWFVLLYLLIISATFIYFIATFWNIFPGVFWATLGVFAAGVVAGRLIYKVRMNILGVSGISLLIVLATLYAATIVRWPDTNFLGVWTVPFWAAVCLVFLYLGAILPLPAFIQPVNFVAFFPALGAVVLIIIGALLSPITNIHLTQPAYKSFFPSDAVGPLWPVLFVAIACGAISGWHALVGSSSTSKQLDVETDAHPVGAGAMLSEGLLGLASLSAYMIVSPDVIKQGNVGAWVFGATTFTQGYLPFGDIGLKAFFGMALVIFAITVQALVTRFWRLVAAEVSSGTSVAWFGHKQVATIVGLAVPWLLAVTGSWINLWLYFGGSNQLVAGLALWLISIHFARTRAPSRYTLIPAIFMTITTISALGYQTLLFARAGFGLFGTTLWSYATDKGLQLFLPTPANPLVQAGQWIALPENKTFAYVFNLIFAGVGLMLFLLGIRMALYVVDGYRRAGSAPVVPQPTTTPAAAGGDD
jgi:carbon starvation protein